MNAAGAAPPGLRVASVGHADAGETGVGTLVAGIPGPPGCAGIIAVGGVGAPFGVPGAPMLGIAGFGFAGELVIAGEGLAGVPVPTGRPLGPWGSLEQPHSARRATAVRPPARSFCFELDVMAVPFAARVKKNTEGACHPRIRDYSLGAAISIRNAARVLPRKPTQNLDIRRESPANDSGRDDRSQKGAPSAHFFAAVDCADRAALGLQRNIARHSRRSPRCARSTHAL
jgi:hypothetical protein